MHVRGTLSGEVTVGLPAPASRADCRHGGWRLHGDETGAPFASRRQCYAWVRHHRG
ncbi:MAG TPA: hypothetical protein VFI47_02320 [Acidimicrobiales bacterium]|nr:hypothetical protein [Acidimicrobiales bacterium]